MRYLKLCCYTETFVSRDRVKNISISRSKACLNFVNETLDCAQDIFVYPKFIVSNNNITIFK